MTVADLPIRSGRTDGNEPQRFVFNDVDWAFYESVGKKLADRRVFITYYKGKLEIVTASLLHEAISALVVILIRVLAEETSTPIKSAGMTTLRRIDLDAGVEADSSFYTTHELQMRGKTVLDLTTDPPPDLAIEVEVTHRLGTRKGIYRELGVPEVWVYTSGGLNVLIKKGDAYVAVDRSPTFPLISPQEMTGFITAGLGQDETAFGKTFRRHVQAILARA